LERQGHAADFSKNQKNQRWKKLEEIHGRVGDVTI
jgi:hypothetical protein